MSRLPADEERATSRLYSLADGVFAIAMTLLALDLRVPELADNAGDHALVHALAGQASHYESFLLSFYVTGVYWRQHRSEMRTVRRANTTIVRRTLFLLLTVSALPFAAGVLGSYGGQDGTATAVYAGVNALAVGSLLSIRYEVMHRTLPPDDEARPKPRPDRFELRFDFIAFAAAVPAGYIFAGHQLLSLALLLVASRVVGGFVTRRLRALEATPEPV
jgi:uncharacterized membrane protein